jgi:hypothetical protein
MRRFLPALSACAKLIGHVVAVDPFRELSSIQHSTVSAVTVDPDYSVTLMR